MSIKSLWGEEFTLPTVSTQSILTKVKKPKEEKTIEKRVSSKTVPLQEKLTLITQEVMRVLGKQVENTLVIRDRDTFVHYIDKAIENGIIAIDTETNNSLDPITCKLMGACIYTPGEKQAYIPINHIDPSTNQLLPNQLTEQDIKEQFDRLVGTKVLTHNGKFDYQVIHCTCNCDLSLYWDSMIGARLLDENEKSAGLKQQYIEKIDPSQEKYKIDELFENIQYAVVDPNIFALYAATDVMMTYKLYQYQFNLFNQPHNKKLLSLMLNIEMPIVTVSAKMELRGICIDEQYGNRLGQHYHQKLAEIDQKIDVELQKLQPQIGKWRESPEAQARTKKDRKTKSGSEWNKSLSDRLSNPPSISSPTQLAILLYDVLKVKPVDKNNPRGTGEDIIQEIGKRDNIELCSLIVERRGLAKLLGTYIDKLPASLNPKDHRLHGSFNQLGTDTGRFASRDPNLQNIPSHSKDIRKMFIPAPGYKFVGADFSQAEPRLLAWYSQDEKMMEAYRQKRDLYATVASTVFNNKYEDNLEFYPDGTINYEGKERRTFCKSIILGIMYGRGAASIAEQITQPLEKAEEIIDSFFKGFPKVKRWIDQTKASCHQTGYVETICGRRRRLPDIQLPSYEARSLDKNTFNPLLGCPSVSSQTQSLIEKYLKKANSIKTRRDYETLKQEAQAEEIELRSNTMLISQAERQCVNSRVQGGSADITKKAMIAVDQDVVMRELDFHLLLCIHDELIGECPAENAEKAASRLSELMLDAPKPECLLPFKCDAEISSAWYEEEYNTWVREDYENNHHDFEKLKQLHFESTEDELKSIVGLA